MRKQTWYKELDSHIKCIHASSGGRKTILLNSEDKTLYSVVTRVNHLTTKLWLEHVNAIIKELNTKKFEPQRFCWLTEQKGYRYELTNKVKELSIVK